MPDYQFTQDWFSWAPELLEQLVPLLPARNRFLEIGSFEGRSTVWMLEHMLDDGGTIYAIDTWSGGEEHSDIDMKASEDRFDANCAIAAERFPMREVIKVKNTSYRALTNVSSWGGLLNTPYQFIYIDGSHIAKDVLTDACLAWPLLQEGGIMVFDDYSWGNPRDILHRPKLAIDSFVNIFSESIQVLHAGYQFALKKKENQ